MYDKNSDSSGHYFLRCKRLFIIQPSYYVDMQILIKKIIGK